MVNTLILYYIVKLNGLYDILCALSILKYIENPVCSTIHINMMAKYKHNPLFERFLAYWIFTYGFVRIGDTHLIPYSYYIEAAVFTNEMYRETIYFDKGLFVIISSLIMGIITHLHMNTFKL